MTTAHPDLDPNVVYRNDLTVPLFLHSKPMQHRVVYMYEVGRETVSFGDCLAIVVRGNNGSSKSYYDIQWWTRPSRG